MSIKWLEKTPNFIVHKGIYFVIYGFWHWTILSNFNWFLIPNLLKEGEILVSAFDKEFINHIEGEYSSDSTKNCVQKRPTLHYGKTSATL